MKCVNCKVKNTSNKFFPCCSWVCWSREFEEELKPRPLLFNVGWNIKEVEKIEK